MQLHKRVDNCAILIVAAGFEMRARRVVEMLNDRYPARVVLVKYKTGIPQNDENFKIMFRMVSRHEKSIKLKVITFDTHRPDEYSYELRSILRAWRPDAVGEVWMDISALPMQGICASLAAVRESLHGLITQVLYTEAATYFPTKAEAAKSNFSQTSMSLEMSCNLIPKQFGGSSSEVSTCLVVFAGYEKHRSVGVVDELNPSKLVLVFGRPLRPELSWRLDWSQKLHKAIKSTRPTASEIESTFDPLGSLLLLNRYYGFLFADHNISVSPICSKMQCVACYLFWERYRDVQLVFPLPVSYLPKRFSDGYRDTFQFTLPTPSELSLLVPPPLSDVIAR
jgi:hypothetical protein